jgi:aminopeptidase
MAKKAKSSKKKRIVATRKISKKKVTKKKIIVKKAKRVKKVIGKVEAVKPIDIMVNAAEKALKEVMQVKEGERLLVITDQEKKTIGQAFCEAAKRLKTDVRMYFLPEEKRPLSEIPEDLLTTLEGNDVVINSFKGNPAETPFRVKLINKTMTIASRLGHAPGITEQMMTKGPMNVDYARMVDRANRLMEAFNHATQVHITSPGGTDLVLGIEGRGFNTDVLIRHGKWGNLPAGEIWCGPEEDKANGVLVCDGSVGDLGEVPSPVIIRVQNGKIQGVECADLAFASKCVELLKVDEQAYVIGEFGIGVNPGAKITGNLLEDEKAFHTCHVAFGNNAHMPGGKNTSKTHRDFLVRNPDIIVQYNDGSERMLLKDGAIQV